MLDFSSVNHVDVTSVQALLDLRTQFARYAAPAHVQWHFAGVTNRWTKRALVAAGFGFEPVVADVTDGNAKAAAPNGAPSLAIFSTAAIDDGESQVALAKTSPTSKDEESPADAGEVITAVGGVSSASEKAASRTGRKLGSLYGVNRPNFHVDIAAAVESIIAHIEDEDGAEESKGSD